MAHPKEVDQAKAADPAVRAHVVEGVARARIVSLHLMQAFRAFQRGDDAAVQKALDRADEADDDLAEFMYGLVGVNEDEG